MASDDAESLTLRQTRHQVLGAAITIATLGLLLRIWLIYRYPMVFGGDTVLRLVNYEHIILSYQLPLLQAGVHYLHFLSPDPVVVRWMMAVIGAAAGVAFYLCATLLVPRNEAFLGAVLFTTNPFILPLSTVPYQEILMIAGLLLAFYGSFANRPLVASIGLGIACLTRYEAWLACPVLAIDYMWRRGASLRRAIEAGLLFGWAPLAWILYNGALTPAGSFAVESHLSAARLVRWPFLVYVTVRHTPLPTLALGAVGMWVVVRQRLWRNPHFQMLGAFGAVFLIALLFSAHGTAPDPERRVTDREAQVLVVGVTVLATLGLTALPSFRGTVTAICAVLGVWLSDRYMKSETSAPEFALNYLAGQYLDKVVRPGEDVAVLAKPIFLHNYPRQVRQSAGERGYQAAIGILNQLETTPPNFQRLLVASRLGKRQLHSYASLMADSAVVVQPRPLDPGLAWVVLWSDFSPTNQEEAAVAERVRTLEPRWRSSDSTISLAIYRLDSAGRAATH